MRPSDLEHDDCIRIDQEPFSGRTFRVSDVDVEDIGITETVAVTFLSDDAKYALVGATADSSFTVENLDSGEEHTVFTQFIERA